MNKVQSPTSRIQVLFIHGIGEVGGAERELLTYMEHLPSLGYQPTVICPEGGPLRRALHDRGVRTLGAAFPSWRKLSGIWKRWSAVNALRALLVELKPDLIHVNEFWWLPQTRRALPPALREVMPVVAHFRQDLPGEKVRQYELAQATEVCAVSHCVAGTLRNAGVDPHRVHVVHSGVGSEWLVPSSRDHRAAIRRELGVSEAEVVLITVAHLFERKGYEVALRAFGGVVRQGLSAHYVVVGTGDPVYERRVRALCREEGIEDRVHFMGFQDEVRRYLDAADIYVQPSMVEGFGIAVLEAMACGMAAIASKTGGLPDMVVHGETGLLVPPGDVPALAGAMRELIRQGARRGDMAETGRRRVTEHFSVTQMMAALTQVYDRARSLSPMVQAVVGPS